MTHQHSKIEARHLARDAYLYVRQSTLRQVFENQESTRRQYALRERATALGWQPEQVVVVDSDLGQSAATAVDREGFQKLVADVGMGKAGVVIGLEVSRLARNSSDWHRLLEICALTDTLILDEDGLYNPSHYNDRLLLGLKGTMSEAELHTLRARLSGGLMAKASRGELRIGLPVGLVYDEEDRVVLHPDVQVRDAIGLFFETFKRIGTACGVVKYFNQHGLLFPRPSHPAKTRDVLWGPLDLARAVRMLHNPRYAGAYAYGRNRTFKLPDGRMRLERRPRQQWHALLLDAHPGYISWQQYENNIKRLSETARAYGQDRRHGPPREGPALLQGLLVCGVCGHRMTVRYHSIKGRLIPEYRCSLRTTPRRDPTCQVIRGDAIDAAIGKLLLDTMRPTALELTLAVQSEIQERIDEAERLREKQLQRARYEAECARRRYMQVDPQNRLVASSLEADWNEKLRACDEIREQGERIRQKELAEFDETTRRRIMQLADDLPAVWNHPATSHRERKRIAALIIEDVTLIKDDVLTLHVRFRGGATTTLTLPRPLRPQEMYMTKPEVVAEIDALLEHHTNPEVIEILNDRGHRTGFGRPFDEDSLHWVLYNHRLKTLKRRLLEAGFLLRKEMTRMLGLTRRQLVKKQSRGELRARTVNGRGEWLFDPIDNQPEPIREIAARVAKQADERGASGSTGRGAV
jgi:DNA invertase Pin-like site-specific DNA recombinase